MDYRIINAHTHIFPDKIADKAAVSIGDYYHIPPQNSATISALLRDSEGFNVTNMLICSAALSPQQTETINNYMSEYNKDERFVALGTVHPNNENWCEELERVKALGLHGIKLHPDFQKFDIDTEKSIAICKKAAALKLPILFHIGDRNRDGSSPTRLREVMRRVPDLICIAAHMGGYAHWDEAYEILPVSDNLYFDTSSALDFITKEQSLRIIEKHGLSKFMFGTDFPLWKTEDEYQRILNLGLTETENKAVFSENFRKLFGIR